MRLVSIDHLDEHAVYILEKKGYERGLHQKIEKDSSVFNGHISRRRVMVVGEDACCYFSIACK